MTDFSMYAGDDKTVEITVRNSAGDPVDITTAAITWNAATLPFGVAALTKAGAIIDGPNGRFNIVLVPADTAALFGNFYQSAKIVDAGKTSTLGLGIITILPGPGIISIEMFKARFPEFAAVPNTIIQMVIDEVQPQIGETWSDRDRSPAMLYLTAHILAMQGYPGAVGGGSPGTAGSVKRRKVGDVETEFFGQVGTGGTSGSVSWYNSTPYGQQYILIRRRNFSAIAVV